MKKKVILICLLSSLMISSLAGCSSSTDKSSSTNTTKKEETNIDESKIESEVKDKINANNSTVDASEIEDHIIIKDESFVTQMDKVYENIDAYLGKTMTVEGIVTDVAQNEFLLVRYYDMAHGDHTHEQMVGIDAIVEGSVPDEDTWVKATGTIDKFVEGDIVTPVLRISKMDIMFTEGQRKVTN